MKKFICSKVKFIEDRFVVSIVDGTLNLTAGKTMEVIDSVSASIQEEYSQSFAGKQITQTLQVEGEFGATIANRLVFPLIFELTLSDERKVIWGDKNTRCKVKSQNLTAGQGVMNFERKTTAFQF